MDNLIISAIISGVSIIIGALIQSKLKILYSKKDFKEIESFPAPSGKKYNDKFYDCFISKINKSTDDIFITGDGMNFSNKKGTEIAENFHTAFKNALNRGVNVVRIQTVNQIHPKWAEMIGELFKYENFKLYFLRNPDESNTLNLCTIDPHCEKKNILELMLPIKAPFGEYKSDVAGVGVFFKGYKSLSLDITSRIQEIANNSIKIDSKEELSQYIINTK
jgi:hypothetical protein